MKKLSTFFALLLLANFAKAQCTPSPTFSVATAKAVNHPLQVKATITTPSTTWPIVSYHAINWGDGSGVNNNSTTIRYHDYASPGTYTVKYYLSKIDSSSTGTLVCYDSASTTVTVDYCNGTVKGFTDSVNTTTHARKFTVDGVIFSPGSVAWDLGDGTTSTSPQVTHTYTTTTPKTVKLYSYGSGCADTFTKVIVPTGSGCIGKVAGYTQSTSGLQATFTNTSTTGGTMTYNWYFGDGNTSTAQHPVHTYASAGTYGVMLVTTWNGVCQDSMMSSVTVSPPPPNKIEGFINKDSTVAPLNPNYKVWLIVFDSAANTLTAVDSLTVTGTSSWGWDHYQFNNIAPGQYRVKAAMTNGPTSGTGYVPTYSTSSLSWSTASVINHTGGTSQWHNIIMQSGTVTGGPGFVGGSISMGANKGTASGVPGVDVYLVDITTNKLAKAAKTDANGDYSFTNVPQGMYQIQPEWMGYRSTSSVPFTISNTNTKVEKMWFLVSNSKKTITPVPASVADRTNDVTFDIYPNPAKSKTTIQWNGNTTADANVIITDITGKQVYSHTMKAAGQTEIDLSNVSKGLYFINISAQGIQHTQKLVVE